MKYRITNQILILLCLLLVSTIFAQNAGKLDSNYGFRNFKFGTEVSNISNIKRTNNVLNNMDEYIYIGNEIQNIQEVKISRVVLYFFKNKLAVIGVDFGWDEEYTQSQYNQVNYGLQNSFGKTSINCIGQSNTLNCDIWMGKEVKLEHNRITGNSGSVIGYLIFEEQNLRQKRINLDF